MLSLKAWHRADSKRLLHVEVEEFCTEGKRYGAVQSCRRDMSAVGNPLALGVFPVAAVEEPRRLERWPVDVVETSRVHGDLVRLRARHVKAMHAAMRAECMLRHAGAEGVDSQRVLAAQQLKIGREDRQVENPLLGTNTAATLRQEVQIDPGAEPYSAAVAATFAGFKHHVAPNDDPRLVSQIC